MPTPAVSYDALRAFAYEWFIEGVQRGVGASSASVRDHWQSLESLRLKGF
jgi:hypothetical protein